MNTNREDNLINTILDGGSIDAEWSEYADRADSQPQLWRQLAEAQRDHIALMRVASRAGAIAEDVSTHDEPRRNDASAIATLAMDAETSRLRHWLGWAVAAAVVIVAGLVQLRGPDAQPPSQMDTTAQTAGWSPEQYLQQYVQQGKEQGTVIRELPQRVLIQAAPAETGIGYEVIFLRQIQERMVVPDLYQVTGQDDNGSARLVGYEPARGGAM